MTVYVVGLMFYKLRQILIPVAISHLKLTKRVVILPTHYLLQQRTSQEMCAQLTLLYVGLTDDCVLMVKETFDFRIYTAYRLKQSTDK